MVQRKTRRTTADQDRGQGLQARLGRLESAAYTAGAAYQEITACRVLLVLLEHLENTARLALKVLLEGLADLVLKALQENQARLFQARHAGDGGVQVGKVFQEGMDYAHNRVAEVRRPRLGHLEQ